MVSLCPVVGERFGYSLANGIVGMYAGTERQWRIKVTFGTMHLYITLSSASFPPSLPPSLPAYLLPQSKNQPICLHSFNVDEDGVPELVTGWANGKMDVRHSTTGEVVYKDSFGSHVAGIVQVSSIHTLETEGKLCEANMESRCDYNAIWCSYV